MLLQQCIQTINSFRLTAYLNVHLQFFTPLTQPHSIILLLNIWGQYILIIISITEGCRKLKTVRTDYNVLEHTFIILIICYTCNMYLKPLRCWQKHAYIWFPFACVGWVQSFTFGWCSGFIWWCPISIFVFLGCRNDCLMIPGWTFNRPWKHNIKSILGLERELVSCTYW